MAKTTAEVGDDLRALGISPELIALVEGISVRYTWTDDDEVVYARFVKLHLKPRPRQQFWNIRVDLLSKDALQEYCVELADSNYQVSDHLSRQIEPC